LIKNFITLCYQQIERNPRRLENVLLQLENFAENKDCTDRRRGQTMSQQTMRMRFH